MDSTHGHLYKMKRARSKSVKRSIKKKKTGSVVNIGRTALPMYAPLKASQEFEMRYYDVITNASAGGAPGRYIMALNGMYDPNITGIGHQPRGFDQMMALYNNYLVKKAYIRFSCSTWSGAPIILGIHISNLSTNLASIEEYIEAGNTHYAVQGSAGAPVKEVTYSVDISKHLGKTYKLDDDLMGTSSSNPAEILYAHCFYHEFGQSNELTAPLNIEVRFYGVLLQQKVPGQS